MKEIVTAKLILDRVEVHKTRFDKRGRPVEEQTEFYTPIDEELSPITIGFDLTTGKTLTKNTKSRQKKSRQNAN